MEISKLDRFRGCLLGLACGDALGTTVEFRRRGTFPRLTDMTGGGPFGLLPGEWTDDTSMALCLGHSLVHCRGFDPVDQMNRYCNWYNFGYMSSNGECFDIGNTVAGALRRYLADKQPFAGSTSPDSAGNGALMRLAPIAMCYANHREILPHMAAESTRTTHAAPEALDCSRLFALQLAAALHGADKGAIRTVEPAVQLSAKVQDIASGTYLDKGEESIFGTGYAVVSLEAALWCFHTTDSFQAAILKAANLGDDADTTAAICGQLAGAHYGIRGIPEAWLNKLVMRDEIAALADALLMLADENLAA